MRVREQKQKIVITNHRVRKSGMNSKHGEMKNDKKNEKKKKGETE